MSRAFLLQRPRTCARTSRPHRLWVHPGVRGGAGVSRLISCSLWPPTPSSSAQAGLLPAVRSRDSDPSICQQTAAGDRPAGTFHTHLPGLGTRSPFSDEDHPPLRDSVTGPKPACRGELRGKTPSVPDAGIADRPSAAQKTPLGGGRGLSPRLGTQQARNPKELSLEALSHRSRLAAAGSRAPGPAGSASEPAGARVSFRPRHTPAGVRARYPRVCDAREIIMPARAAMSNNNGPPHRLSTQQGPDAGLNV